MVVPTATNAGIIKNPCRPNERQGFHLFEIPRLPFTRLLVEHKLYITLLLILTHLFAFAGYLAFSSVLRPEGRSLGWLAWTINFLY